MPCCTHIASDLKKIASINTSVMNVSVGNISINLLPFTIIHRRTMPSRRADTDNRAGNANEETGEEGEDEEGSVNHNITCDGCNKIVSQYAPQKYSLTETSHL